MNEYEILQGTHIVKIKKPLINWAKSLKQLKV